MLPGAKMHWRFWEPCHSPRLPHRRVSESDRRCAKLRWDMPQPLGSKGPANPVNYRECMLELDLWSGGPARRNRLDGPKIAP